MPEDNSQFAAYEHTVQMQELKKRARRRLVGASALALLAAIVLPMIMDHEPHPSGQNVQVRIPDQDEAQPPQAAPPAKVDISPPASIARPVAQPQMAPSATQAAAARPEAEAKPKVKQKPEAKPEAKPESKSANKKSVAPKENHSERNKTPAKTVAHKEKVDGVDKSVALNSGAENKRLAKPADNSGAQRWVLFLGAYRDSAHVNTLLGKLKAQGLAAYTEDYATEQGHRTRVRAGPFANREEADSARAKVALMGIDGAVKPLPLPKRTD